ncbi:polyprenyl synthetase family protein [Streptomyces sp. NRRL S-813]|uniref:polyprenyl synthetase family protein n=1 Tax=Streptomyces sp. NRRL S-813 TaxID=1463919 RepID=UPI0007C7E0C9|nr:polyprenyl synthetase family protein [Streptomyces sp. NRRL S-813]
MTAVSYEDLHRRMAAQIEAERNAALDLLGPAAPSIRVAVARLLAHRTFKYPLSVLPLIVHAAETGTVRPAVPLAVVHELWWTAACCLDDRADSQGTCAADDLDESAALLATFVAGSSLPLLVVQSEGIPPALRPSLSAEILKCCVSAAEGQLKDLHEPADTATRASVIETYLGKSGAPFSMITVMAARLAGADEPRVELWREFGDVFGVLWQLFNDQEDILSGRDEDLLNGTVTHLFACALEEAAPDSTEHVMALHRAARTSAHARAELSDLLRTPAVLRRFEKDIDEFRDRAHRILDELGGHERYLPVLRDLVDRSSSVLLRPGQSLGGVSSIMPGSRRLAPHLVALSSVADAPHRLPPPPCDVPPLPERRGGCPTTSHRSLIRPDRRDTP